VSPQHHFIITTLYKSEDNKPTMSSLKDWNATTLASLQDWNITTIATTNGTDYDGGDDMRVFPHARVDVAFTVFSLLVFGFCSLIVILGMCKKLAYSGGNRAAMELEEAVYYESKQERKRSKEERRRKRREFISNGLIVKEWAPVDPQVESTTGDQDTPPTGETIEAPQPPAPPINSSLVSCAMGSDDCESVDGEEEEMAGCPICLRHFKPQQLVCVSNNSSCQHVFHKNCMVDWLMKDHDNCPMCREDYLVVKTV
jgi:hypothetical protein